MTKFKTLIACATAVAVGAVGMLPADASAQSQRELDRRQQTKNEWRNIAYLAGAAAIYGALKGDNTLTFAGAAGALYSYSRYEADRKSQNRLQRLRADYFSRPYFTRDGVRYNRMTTTRNGQRYYFFQRASTPVYSRARNQGIENARNKANGNAYGLWKNNKKKNKGKRK